MKGLSGWLSFTAAVDPPQWMASSNPILFAVGVLNYPMFGPVLEEALKIMQVAVPFPDYRPAIVLPPVFGSLNLELECRGGYELSTSVVILID